MTYIPLRWMLCQAGRADMRADGALGGCPENFVLALIVATASGAGYPAPGTRGPLSSVTSA